MKRSEIKKLISAYFETEQKMRKKGADTFRLSKLLKEAEHRYYHETGRTLKSELGDLREK